ncbi:MAG: hypothetical protein WB782_01625 [Thermoplasmata archaeon]
MPTVENALQAEAIACDDLQKRLADPYMGSRDNGSFANAHARDIVVRLEGDLWQVAGIVDVYLTVDGGKKPWWKSKKRWIPLATLIADRKVFDYRISTNGDIVGVNLDMTDRLVRRPRWSR